MISETIILKNIPQNILHDKIRSNLDANEYTYHLEVVNENHFEIKVEKDNYSTLLTAERNVANPDIIFLQTEKFDRGRKSSRKRNKHSLKLTNRGYSMISIYLFFIVLSSVLSFIFYIIKTFLGEYLVFFLSFFLSMVFISLIRRKIKIKNSWNRFEYNNFERKVFDLITSDLKSFAKIHID